jgi:TolB-like protein/DNA-binding winged helix-turn-helix (wHTH) protein/Flp pilus assembly protein TadD
MSTAVAPPLEIDLAAEPDIRLGGLEVSPAACRVRAGGVEQRIEPRVMQVLVLLARRQGQTVTRDQLIEACWGGRIVSDDAVNRVVAQLRALARSLEPPPFDLETVPKVGFRLRTSPERALKTWSARLLGRVRTPWVAALATAALAVGVGSAWLVLRPAAPSGPTTIAVLPFRNLTSGDANLVDAIWDDTRGALSRNPNLRVLGRVTTEALARQKLDAAGYRSRAAADYLMDASVQRSGEQVQINVSLIRTADGAEVWSDRLGGRLDDILAFQNRIAADVEGRIRGRVAPNRGIKAENIATTGEVYALYAEARGKIRRRDGPDIDDGVELLRRAVALDPNYAPAWAELGIAIPMNRPPGVTQDQRRAEAAAALQRALALAPNLAKTHAALAMRQGFASSTEGELRKAVQLDPGDAEAWLWLGNLLHYQNRLAEAAAADWRAFELDPLWRVAVVNLAGNLAPLRDEAGLRRLFERVRRTGDEPLLGYARWAVAETLNQPAEAARAMLDLRRRFPGEASVIDPRVAGDLAQLGHLDEALRLAQLEPYQALAWSGRTESPEAIRARLRRPQDFWSDSQVAMIYARLLPNAGRLDELVGYYQAAFKSPDELRSETNLDLFFLHLAPNLAVDLRRAGDDREASLLIARAESVMGPILSNGPPYSVLWLDLARLRAAEGRDEEALALLAKAIGSGVLPDRTWYAADIAEEPCFAALIGRPQFQALRRQILDRLEAERRKLGPVVLQ